MKNPPIITIAWPFGAVAPSLHCPRTGNLVLAPDAMIDQPASPCVSFVWIHEIAEFEFIRDDLQGRLDETRRALIKAGADEYDLPSNFEILKTDVDLGTIPVIFEITVSGMACGPVSETVTIGFDLWTADDEG